MTTEFSSLPTAQARVARVFDAPRDLVFKAWADPALLARWYGPRGYSATVDHMDFRVGGTFEMAFIGPDGVKLPFFGEYVEIVPGERIVFTSGFPGGPRDQVHTTVTFADEAGKTRLHVHQIFHVTPGMEGAAAGMQQGWDESVDRLGEFLAGRKRAVVTVRSDTHVVITREFDAPRRLVFEASTRPESMRRWYGPRALTVTDCEIDLRPGGSYRWTLRAPDGSEYKFMGEYREIQAPERMVYTERFLLGDTWTNDVLYAVTLVETGGKTLLTILLTYATRADRDGHLGAGMEEGMAESHERLDELLADLVSAK